MLPLSIQPSMPADASCTQRMPGCSTSSITRSLPSPHQTMASAASGASTTAPPPAVTASTSAGFRTGPTQTAGAATGRHPSETRAEGAYSRSRPEEATIGTPEHARARAAAVFNAAADRYDDAPNTFWARFGRETVERLELPAGARVLDVCCGSGASAIPAAEHVGPSGYVLAVDLADRLLDLAREKARAAGLRPRGVPRGRHARHAAAERELRRRGLRLRHLLRARHERGGARALAPRPTGRRARRDHVGAALDGAGQRRVLGGGARGAPRPAPRLPALGPHHRGRGRARPPGLRRRRHGARRRGARLASDRDARRLVERRPRLGAACDPRRPGRWRPRAGAARDDGASWPSRASPTSRSTSSTRRPASCTWPRTEGVTSRVQASSREFAVRCVLGFLVLAVVVAAASPAAWAAAPSFGPQTPVGGSSTSRRGRSPSRTSTPTATSTSSSARWPTSTCCWARAMAPSAGRRPPSARPGRSSSSSRRT